MIRWNLTLDLPLAADDVVEGALAGNEAGQEDRGQEDEEEGTHGDQADVVSSGNLRQLWDFLLMSSWAPASKDWNLRLKDAAILATRGDQTVVVSRSPVMQPWQSEDKIKGRALV